MFNYCNFFTYTFMVVFYLNESYVFFFYTFLNIYIYMYVCMYVCMYIIGNGGQNDKFHLKIFKLYRIISTKKNSIIFFKNWGGGPQSCWSFATAVDNIIRRAK